MRSAIDSPRGQALYSRRIATVGQDQGGTQWQLYCLVHNIEKIATQAMRAH